jgi:hypothetical protein
LQSSLDDWLNGPTVEGSKDTGEMTKSEDRIATNISIWVPCQSEADLLGPHAAWWCERDGDRNMQELSGVAVCDDGLYIRLRPPITESPHQRVTSARPTDRRLLDGAVQPLSPLR